MSKPYLSIVIPTLNEEHNIKILLDEIKPVLKNYKYEIIIVDGHSKDKTVAYAKKYGARILYDSVGKGSALIKGFNAVKGDITISMDADLSNRPNELRLLIAGIEAGYDVCMGSRFLTGGGSDDMPFHRKLGNRFFVSIVNLRLGSNYTDMCYGYRSFAKGIARKLKLKETGFGIETEISIKANRMHMRVLEIPSYEKLRASGEGKLRSVADGWTILRAIIRNF